MSTTPHDTSLAAAKAHREVLRSLGIEGRARLFFQLCAQARALTHAGIRRRHPEYDEEQVRLAALKLRVGDELFARAFPGRDIDP